MIGQCFTNIFRTITSRFYAWRTERKGKKYKEYDEKLFLGMKEYLIWIDEIDNFANWFFGNPSKDK